MGMQQGGKIELFELKHDPFLAEIKELLVQNA